MQHILRRSRAALLPLIVLATALAMLLTSGQVHAQTVSAACVGNDLVLTWASYPSGIYFTNSADQLVYQNNSTGGTATLTGPGTWTGLVARDLGGFINAVPLGDFTCPSAAPPSIQPGIPVPQPGDMDGDGVIDSIDACPQQGDAGYGLDANGCPLPVPVKPSWEGNPRSSNYDRRLNPSAAEYYTVYCQADTLHVYRADGLLLKQIPLSMLSAMDPLGSTLDAGDNMTLGRSNDSMIIAGSNGNQVNANAPAGAGYEGFQSFSLSQCLANGATS